jgi:hypothetical protein
LHQLSFGVSLHCVIIGEVADILRWREICTGVWQLEVLCLHVLWRVQILPDACRSLPFSAVYFSFTDPGGKELRQKRKKKKKKKKAEDQLWLSDLVPSWQTDR